jgi:hypothetical protein
VSERVQHQLIGYAFAGTAKASFLKISSEPKHADATSEALWKVMAKQLYNDIMVRSQRGASTGAKIDPGETVDDLSERLHSLAICLPELEGAAGDAVLLQRFTDALPEELQVHAYGISGYYDHLIASLSRIQKTLGKKDKPGVTWRARRAEQVNKILDRASVYHNDDLSMEEVVKAILDIKGGRAVGERGDGWRGGGGGGGRDAAATSITLEPVKPPQRRLRLWSSTRPRRWGIARIQLGLMQACRWRGSPTVPPGSASAATGSDIPAPRRQPNCK